MQYMQGDQSEDPMAETPTVNILENPQGPTPDIVKELGLEDTDDVEF